MSTRVARSQPKGVTDLVRHSSLIGVGADKDNIGIALDIAVTEAVAGQAVSPAAS